LYSSVISYHSLLSAARNLFGKILIFPAWLPQDQENEEQDKKLRGQTGFMG